MKKKIPLFFLLALLALAGPASGQFYFGKNKVQYTQFDWRVLKTDHFEVYFYVEEEEIAQLGARIAEEAYLDLRQKFNHEIFDPIPFIVYSSPHYFEQTNVVPSLLPENVAGFTEFIKGRMVIPFDGSYAAFAKVVKHELVHVFTFEKLSYNHGKYRKIDYSPPSLWFTEGIAEFWSKDWDTQADMVLRDLVISGQLVPISDIFVAQGTYLMYKEGESFCHFLADTYGEERLTRLFDNYWREKDFEAVMALVFQKPLAQLDREWQLYLKQKYFPDIQDRKFLSHGATKLTVEGFNTSPTLVEVNHPGKTSTEIAFKTNRRGYSTICMMPESGEKTKLKTLVKGERSASYESLHLLGNRISANRMGEIAFSSKNRGKDYLYVYDTKYHNVTKQYQFLDLVGIQSPTWSPSGDRICLVGVTKEGFANLYIFDLKSEKLTQLTDDIYQEKDPAWSPAADEIVFSSDRGEKGVEGFQNLFKLNLSSGEITQLTSGPFHDNSPTWSKSGTELVFSSDRDGVFNLYSLDSLGQLTQLTRFVTSCFDPQLSQNDRQIVFSGFENYSFNIYSVSLDSTAPEAVSMPLSQSKIGWQPATLELPSSSMGNIKYQNRFSFDLAQSAVAYDAFFGIGGGFQAGVSDMLGDHQYAFLISNSAESKDDFLKSFNLAVTYISRQKRLNYGYGLFHFYQRYLDEVNGDYNERQYGGALFASYPFSKFQRFETSLFARRSERERLYSSNDRRAFLVTHYLAWIKDTSLWELTGPLEGTRLNLTLGLTYSLDGFKPYNRIVSADFRKYFRLGGNSCVATRLMGYSSEGAEPQRIYLGGSWSLRGYDRKAFLGKNVTLANAELRFPLIDDLSIRFPVGKIGFQAIRGAIFLDAGKAWEDKLERLYGSMGFGARLSLGYLTVLRFDWAWTTNFYKVNPGPNFDFFFGWNF